MEQRCLRSRVVEVSKRSRRCPQKPKEEKQPKLSRDAMIPIFWRLPTSELIRFVSNQANHPLGKYWSAGLKFVVEKRLPFSLKPSVAKGTINYVIYDVSGSKVAEIKQIEHFHRSPLFELLEQVELPFYFPKKSESNIVSLFEALPTIPSLDTFSLSLGNPSRWEGNVRLGSLGNFLVPDLVSQLASISLSVYSGFGDLAPIITRATSLTKLSVDERQFVALLSTSDGPSSQASASPVATVLAGLESLVISRGANESWRQMVEFLGSHCTQLRELELPLRGPVSDCFVAFQTIPNLRRLGLDAELIPASKLPQRLAVDDSVATLTSVTEFRWCHNSYVKEDQKVLFAMLSKLPNVRSLEIQGLPCDAMLRLASTVCSNRIFNDLQTLKFIRDNSVLSGASLLKFISDDNLHLPSTVDLSQVGMAPVKGPGSHKFLVEVFRAMEENGITSLLFRATVPPQATKRLRDYLELLNPANATHGLGHGRIFAWRSGEADEGNASDDLQFTDLKLEGMKSSGPAKGAAFKEYMACEQDPQFNPDSIPCELWLSIFGSLNVDASDLCSLSQTCKFFHCLSTSDQIWLVKFQQRWPNLYASLPYGTLCNWLALFQRRLRVVKLVAGGLKDLSARFCHSLSLYLSYTSFAYFEQIAQQDEEFGLAFVIDELREILHLPRAVQLTAKFYARQLIRFLIARVLEPDLERWSRDEGHLETGAILLAQWCQPEMYPKEAEILSFLDSVADATKLKLKESNSHHPLLATSDSHVVDSSSTESLWQPQSCLEILKALNSVFVNDLGFIGNADGYYSLYNSFLNKVIEKRTGIPITLCVLYHAIARRLGVYTEPVSYPSHFLLKVRISSEAQDDNAVYKYIDVFNGCRLMSEDETWIRLRPGVNVVRTPEMFQRVAPTQVLKRMLNNITSISNMDDDESTSPLVSCSALEMGRVLMPDDAAQKLLLARCYVNRDINLEAVVQLMELIPDAGLEWSLRAQKVHVTALANAKLIKRGIDEPEV